MKRRAVITGLGPISCIGIGKKVFRDALHAEKSGITQLTRFANQGVKPHCAGEINDFDPTPFFSSQQLKRSDRYSQFAVVSARLALQDAGLAFSSEIPNPRAGVSFGTALAGISCAEAEHQKFIKNGPRAINQTLALQIFGGAAHSNIAIACGFQGPGTTNSNSCTSGAIALGEALYWIRSGLCDFVVAGAAEAPLNPLTYAAFANIRTMSRAEPPHACRPFDLRRDGFVMGEGAGSLIVEEYEHAKKRGAHIYAELSGYALNNDAYHMTTPRPDGKPVVQVMHGALKDAHLNPEDIDYINAHASSTQINDANESACIRKVFGDRARKELAISGTKSYTAHPLGATGALEAIICCLAFEDKWLPPTLHYETPDPACDINIIANHGREAAPRAILNNCFGFGGINASVVFTSV
ncbi:MAG: beta-ketoacyl-[acyl-carrier-protein] synthase family protein [Chthoniobacterales bacterium]